MRFVFKDSNEKLDIKVKSRFEWDFFPWGAFLIEEKCYSFHCRNVFLLEFLHIFAICNESMKTEDDFF